ncbi:tail tape measure protein [Synechococcus phage S-LBS1]|nr:tail tape measure protein [Synechococcus phage S-LBS1]
MAQMQALLKIKADVDGEGKVNALGRAIGGLSGTAGKVSGGLKGLAGAAGGLSGALGSLVPLATGAGLAAMAKNAIDAADDMNDLSQKTGVSVESLSKFQQAANASGTSIEGVGAAMIKLNRNLATGNDGAAEALTSLGLSATDASGKLKSTDAIMLEVADKFAKMPDGAGKTAAAMALFGKAGADMIPLLNGGSKAVTDLSATMTGTFAKGADSLNDKLAALQGKLLALGVNIGTALMPALNVIADLVMGLANAFAAMPGPIQAIVGGAVALAAAFVVLAPAISAVISIAGVLAGLQIGATIAGWAALAGPAITAISAAFSGLLAFLTGTLLPGLLAFFSGPVGWTVLAVAAVVAMVILFREPLTDFAAWLLTWGEQIGQFFTDNVTTPIINAWTAMVEFLPKALNTAAATIKSVFTGVGTAITAVLNGVLRGVFGAVNGAIGNINRLINAANNLSARVNGPQLPTLPTLSVPQFAQGGVVTGPTLAMVGEGGEPEYIIPASKMAAASANYLNGARGGAVIPAFANGGFVGGNAQINVTTGPVMQQGGQQYVTMADLERAMRKTADGVYASLRTPAGRYAVGTR